MLKRIELIFIFFLFISISGLFSQDHAYVNYTIENGLASNYVYQAFQDSKGFMWFSTNAGVSRFDGNKFQNFSLSDGVTDIDIFDIHEDKKGRIWFATYNGRLCFYWKGKFHNSENDPWLKGKDLNSYISTMYEDSEGNLWIGTYNGSVIRIDMNDTINFIKTNFMTNGYKSRRLYAIWEDNLGGVLALTDMAIENLSTSSAVATYKDLGFEIGLQNSTHVRVLQQRNQRLILTENGNFYEIDQTDYKRAERKTVSQLSQPVIFMELDSNGTFWAGTFNGIYKMSESLLSQPQLIPFLNEEIVTSRCIDITGSIWYTTLNKGIFRTPSHQVVNYTIDSGLPEKEVNAVTGHASGEILIGQNEYYSFVSQGRISSYTDNPYYKKVKIKKSMGQKIKKVGINEDGDFWVASNYGLLLKTEKDTNYFHLTTRDFSFGPNNSFWIATNGLFLTNSFELSKTLLANGKFNGELSHSNFKNKFYDNLRVLTLYWSNINNTLWVGLQNGVMRYRNNEFVSFSNDNLNVAITDLVGIDGDKRIWVATLGKGILLINESGQVLQHINEKDGLTNNKCKAIEIDEQLNLWVATDNGLNEIVFNEQGEFRVIHYGKNDGLLSNQINDIHVNNKTVWVATDEGLSAMDMHASQYTMPVYITDVFVNGHLVSEIDTEQTLTYHENNIVIDFVALDFTMEEKQYRYKINERDQWRYTKNNTLEFPSLSSGNYNFIVQAKNKNGNWNEQTASFLFNIKPAPWKSWWAFTLYSLGLLGIIVVAFMYEIRRKALKSNLQVERVKSNFFSNISHELRTPLTLIVGPLEKIINSSTHNDIRKNALLAHKSADTLHQLINQLLDISKIDAEKMDLYLEHKNILEDITLCCDRFEGLAKSKGIDFSYSISNEPLITSFDPKKLEVIVNNLLSNAMKFTLKGGSIQLIADVFENEHKPLQLRLKVIDSGIGISQENIPHVFDRFYQVDSTLQKTFQGTGIGLALTKEFVELHNGKITVESEIGKGSTFTCFFPIIKEQIETSSVPETIEETTVDADYETSTSGNQHSKVLVVEDSPELLTYIIDTLKDEFEVMSAKNGEEGFKVAAKTFPDLVLSDVMMPIMDGFELCKKIKQNELTSHIPVILLTAKAATESKIEGLDIGADDYLAKPFNYLELKARIRNLIETREKLRERFKLITDIRPSDLAFSVVDQDFLNRCIKVIEDNLTNTEFDVTLFTREIGMSRTQLHQKLKAISGQSASEFNRTIRLKKALVLLKDNTGTIAEISAMIGFRDPAYFTRCFKKQFGKSPSEFYPEN